MNILITGGAGYKGVKLTAKLLEKGYKVTVLDNFMYGFEPFLHLVENKNLTVIRQDVRNRIENIHQFDVIYHLAGLSGLPACAANPSSAHLINVEATKQLAGSLNKDQLLIYASTTSFYGKSGTKCTEDTPVDPVSHYGKTKYLAEQIVMEHPNSISLRFATVFGFSPKMRMDLMVNDFTYKALSQGYLVVYEKHFMRTFIHVHDMGRAFVLALEKPDLMRGNVYNIGSNSMNFSKEKICDLIQDQTRCYVHFADVGEDADKRNYIVSYEKINKLGYDTTISAEGGISELVRALTAISFKTPYGNA